MSDTLNVDHLNDGQKKALDELKRRVSKFKEAYLHDEHYLIHWLVARKFNVNHAEEMLLNHYEYRKALNMDHQSYKSYQVNHVMQVYYPHGVFSHDKDGHPVAYFPIGGVDNKGIVKSVKSSDINKAIMYWQEQRTWNCADASKIFGKKIQQCTYILDLKGLTTKHLWKPGVDAFQYVLQLVERHTPEIISRLFVINAPSVFPILYKIIQPIVDENTRRKIQIFGEDYKDALLNVIDVDQLPVHYGGNALDSVGDPDCKEHITYGRTVPLDMYYKPVNEPDESELTNLHIKRGKEALVPVSVEKPGSVLRWFLKSDSALDFGFGIYRKPLCENGEEDQSDFNHNNSSHSDSEEDQSDFKRMTMVEPYFRTFAHYVPESGEYVAKVPGTYIFRFDNSYSWFHGKSIQYKIIVDDPNHVTSVHI